MTEKSSDHVDLGSQLLLKSTKDGLWMFLDLGPHTKTEGSVMLKILYPAGTL